VDPRQKPQSSIPIPMELFQYSGQFMTGLEFISAMRLVSKRFHGLFKFTNNRFWAELYRRDFGPLPSDAVTDEVKAASRDVTIDLDFKIQYIAAH
jgi:hypothetical protein